MHLEHRVVVVARSPKQEHPEEDHFVMAGLTSESRVKLEQPFLRVLPDELLRSRAGRVSDVRS
jgi:hypothetical protein